MTAIVMTAWELPMLNLNPNVLFRGWSACIAQMARSLMMVAVLSAAGVGVACSDPSPIPLHDAGYVDVIQASPPPEVTGAPYVPECDTYSLVIDKFNDHFRGRVRYIPHAPSNMTNVKLAHRFETREAADAWGGSVETRLRIVKLVRR